MSANEISTPRRELLEDNMNGSAFPSAEALHMVCNEASVLHSLASNGQTAWKAVPDESGTRIVSPNLIQGFPSYETSIGFPPPGENGVEISIIRRQENESGHVKITHSVKLCPDLSEDNHPEVTTSWSEVDKFLNRSEDAEPHYVQTQKLTADHLEGVYNTVRNLIDLQIAGINPDQSRMPSKPRRLSRLLGRFALSYRKAK